MCVTWAGNWRKTKREMIVYKIVRIYGDHYISQYPVDSRVRQVANSKSALRRTGESIGTLIHYIPGEVVSSQRPGIYCYLDPPSTLPSTREHTILWLRIEKGTWIRRGRRYDSITICTEQATVGGMC